MKRPESKSASHAWQLGQQWGESARSPWALAWFPALFLYYSYPSITFSEKDVGNAPAMQYLVIVLYSLWAQMYRTNNCINVSSVNSDKNTHIFQSSLS